MTSNSTFFDPLFAYIQRDHPLFRKSCVGAIPGDIDELEALAGHPLPPVYREFLTRMGLEIGDIELLHADYNIDSLISRYFVHEPDHPRHFILIGLDLGEMSIDYYIDFSDTSQVDGPIVAFDYNAGAISPLPIFHSFRGHVIAAGVRRYGLARYPQQRLVELPPLSSAESLPSLLQRANALLERAGFSTVLTDDRSCLFLERPDTCALVLDLPTTEFLRVELAGEDPKALAHLEEVLRDNWP